ncbi:LCP family protein [Brevibacillus sp. 179-C 1.1 NHS]|uniref:LCP family glycopolymer transferase n=1 Tax=Brevibacillus sp. 179-C 1.1 NHS TaxID=3235177 RepID=UPI0039A01990
MKRWGKWVLIILLAVGLCLGIYAWYLYYSVKTVIEKTYEPIRINHLEKSERREEKVSIQKKDPISILMLGIDEEKISNGRSDTIIVVTINPDKKSVLLFNIPRDTRTEIIGKGTTDKINHAYAFGGVEMAVHTVEEFLQIPIDYYIKVNMKEFVKVIDQLGGVTVENKTPFSYEDHSFKKGTLHLNGDAALAYTRMRYDDPRGDMGRNKRQREVIRSLIRKVESPEMLPQMEALFEKVASSVKTNLTFDDVKEITFDYRAAVTKFQDLELKGTGEKLNGIYYYVVSQEERQRVSQKLNEELSKSPTGSTEEIKTPSSLARKRGIPY